jgi:hypothetical protein
MGEGGVGRRGERGRSAMVIVVEVWEEACTKDGLLSRYLSAKDVVRSSCCWPLKISCVDRQGQSRD